MAMDVAPGNIRNAANVNEQVFIGERARRDDDMNLLIAGSVENSGKLETGARFFLLDPKLHRKTKRRAPRHPLEASRDGFP